MIHRKEKKKKKLVRRSLDKARFGKLKRLLWSKLKRFFFSYYINIFILFINLAIRRLVVELSKLIIDPLVKSNIFFFHLIHRKKKRKEKKRKAWLGWVVKVKNAIANKTKVIFLLFILFIYLAIQLLIEEQGKLLINPLAKINIMFLYDS